MGVPSLVDELIGPVRVELNPGDTVIENETMLHFGANRTADPVIILATLLTEAGVALAVPVLDLQAR